MPTQALIARHSPFYRSTYNKTDAQVLASVLGALADPARLRMLGILHNKPDGLNVTEIVKAFKGDLSQPTISHHLRVLAEAGYVESSKTSVYVYYRAVPGRLTEVRGALTEPGAGLVVETEPATVGDAAPRRRRTVKAAPAETDSESN